MAHTLRQGSPNWMIYFWWSAGIVLALAWFSRIVEAALGMPTVADISRPEWDRPVSSSGNPKISIIVPARNEEETIEASLRSLLWLDHDHYEVIVVNDRSTDRTGEIMDRLKSEWDESSTGDAPCLADFARRGNRGSRRPILRMIHHAELPHGWLGKTHAMWTAANAASGEWLLFTDADVIFRPDSLRRALVYAEAEKADHVVLFPRMIMKTLGERMMIAFFQTLFMFGHRPWKVADPKANDHMGVGAFNLVRRRVYDAIGTYAALRMEVVDDMKLGKLVKTSGFTQRNVFGDDLISIRWARGAIGVVNNLTKNFFAVLSFQRWRTLASAFALTFLNLGPFLGIWLAHGWARLAYAIALASMFCIYIGISRRSSVPAYYFFLHPVSSALFVYTLLRSMVLTLWHDGVIWRGTRYPLEDLRKGLV